MKALEIAQELGIGADKFTASEGWLSNFKKRHSLVFRRVQGEAGQVDNGALQDWQNTILRRELDRFLPENIYNVDESGLFWKLLPNKTKRFGKIVV